MSLATLGFSVVSGLALAQEVAPDASQLVEKFGMAGAFGIMLWFMLNGFAKRLDKIEDAIKQLTAAILKEKQ